MLDNEGILNTKNMHYVVTCLDGTIILVMTTGKSYTCDAALNLAAWLVAATGRRDEFNKLLDAILST